METYRTTSEGRFGSQGEDAPQEAEGGVMAVNVQRYALLYEKYKQMGLGEEEAQRRAIKEATIMPTKKKKESTFKRLARLTRMAALGGRYKSKWQREQEQRQLKTVRTKAVSGRLREAGLSEAEIKRLRRR